MAQAAGRKNYELRKEPFEYLMALFYIADIQHTAGQMPQFAATLKQIRQVIDESEGGKGEIDSRPRLAMTQAQAGLLEAALTTVRSIRDAKTRSQGYILVATALTKVGRWREALAVANKEHRDKNAESAEAQIMSVLIDTGRRDWVLEAIPVLASGAEPVVLARLELRLENFEAARTQAQRLADPDLRLQMIEQIADELDQRQAWAELVTTARLIPADATKITSDSWRHIHYKLAAEWLIKGGALDDALTLLPRLSADDRQKTLIDIVYEHALAGDPRKATELMKSLQFEWRDDVLPAIAFAKVLSGQENSIVC
jgi:tetratricopeptide (TPR) repeat protein